MLALTAIFLGIVDARINASTIGFV